MSPAELTQPAINLDFACSLPSIETDKLFRVKRARIAASQASPPTLAGPRICPRTTIARCILSFGESGLRIRPPSRKQRCRRSDETNVESVEAGRGRKTAGRNVGPQGGSGDEGSGCRCANSGGRNGGKKDGCLDDWESGGVLRRPMEARRSMNRRIRSAWSWPRRSAMTRLEREVGLTR